MEPIEGRRNPPPTSVGSAGEQSAAAEAEAEAASFLPMGDWPSLTDPLLMDILHRLDTLQDYFALRGVCRSWRALAAPTPYTLASQHPLLLVTLLPDNTEVAFYDIIRGRLYRVRLPWGLSIAYAHGYLVISTGDAIAPELLLWNVFTAAWFFLPKIPHLFDRVLLSSHPSTSGCLVLLLKRSTRVLQFLRIGDPLWTVVDFSEPLQFLYDMIFFENKLYALTAKMLLIKVDLVAGVKYEVLGDADDSLFGTGRYQVRWLAVSGKELLAVCFKFVGDGFDVFRWDFGSNGWEEIYTFGGRSLFMGINGFAGSVAASEVGIIEDSIYYLNDRGSLYMVFSLYAQCTMGAFPALSGLPMGPLAPAPIWVLPSIS